MLPEASKIINENIRFHATISLATLAAFFTFLGSERSQALPTWALGLLSFLLIVSILSSTYALWGLSNEIIRNSNDLDKNNIRLSMIVAILSYYGGLVLFVIYGLISFV